MKRRRIFLLEDRLQNSLLDQDNFLAVNDLQRTTSIDDADILAGRRMRSFTEQVIEKGRLNILWTHEPFFSDHAEPCIRLHGGIVHVFNVYNGNVYTDNFYDMRRGPELPKFKKDSLNQPHCRKNIVALMTCKQNKVVVQGDDVSLTQIRNELAKDGRAEGSLDIYGRDWPSGIAIGESRFVNRAATKAAILRSYNYNLCMENTNWDYYTTEKIWDAVAGGCLPIYFPNEAFKQLPIADCVVRVDGSSSFVSIRAAIESIAVAELVDRMSALTDFYNRCVRLGLRDASRKRTRRLLSSFLRGHC
jgi:hypothetical protein